MSAAKIFLTLMAGFVLGGIAALAWVYWELSNAISM